MLRLVALDVRHDHLLVGGLALAGVHALGPHGNLVQREDLEVGDHQRGFILGHAVEGGEGRVDGQRVGVVHGGGVNGGQNPKVQMF